MEKKLINLVLINDDDLECNCDNLTLTDLDLTKTNFTEEHLRDIDLVVYSGRKGTKILKSSYFKKGKIK